MKPSVLLTVLSLLSIVLLSIHITDDIVRNISPPGADNMIAVAIFAVWLYGTLVLRERLAGRIIMLLGALFAAAMPVLHMRGASYPEIARSGGGFIFVWTLFAVGTTGVISFILAARELWAMRAGVRKNPTRTQAMPK